MHISILMDMMGLCTLLKLFSTTHNTIMMYQYTSNNATLIGKTNCEHLLPSTIACCCFSLSLGAEGLHFVS